jgi:hypothetical protein
MPAARADNRPLGPTTAPVPVNLSRHWVYRAPPTLDVLLPIRGGLDQAWHC